MTFNPINGDHAIQVVSFSAALGRRLTTPDLNAVRANHKRWRAELPATTNPQGFEIQVDGSSGSPQMIPSNGIEFSFLRPDGSSAWTLRLLGSDVSVDCFRYTRWDKTWERAHKYLRFVLEILSKPDPEQLIQSFTLTVLDRFRADDLDDSPEQLLKPSAALSPHLLSAGPLWHQHTGWFVGVSGAKVLNQLNIDSKFEQSAQAEVTGLGELIVSIQHMQQWRIDQPLGVRSEISTDLAYMTMAMEFMHGTNKILIGDLLTSQMLDRIAFFSPKIGS